MRQEEMIPEEIVTKAMHTPIEAVYLEDLSKPIFYQNGTRINPEMVEYLCKSGQLVACSDPVTGIKQFKPRGV